jgi:hypothetical protein
VDGFALQISHGHNACVAADQVQGAPSGHAQQFVFESAVIGQGGHRDGQKSQVELFAVHHSPDLVRLVANLEIEGAVGKSLVHETNHAHGGGSVEQPDPDGRRAGSGYLLISARRLQAAEATGRLSRRLCVLRAEH